MRAMAVIFLAVLFQYACGNAINPVLAPLAVQTGIGTVQTGLFFTLSSLMWLAASPFWGRQREIVGRKRVMLIGLGSCFALYMLFGVAGDWGLSHHPPASVLFALLLAIRIVSGVFFSTVPVAAQAYAADTTQGRERTTAVSLIWMASGLGSIMGPAFGVFSADNLMAPLYLGSLLPLIGFFLVWAYLRSPSASEPSARTDPPSAPARPLPPQEHGSGSRIRLFDRRIVMYLFVISSLQASVLAIQVTTGFFMEDHFRLSPARTAQIVGSLFMLAGVVSVASQWAFVRRMKLSSNALLATGAPVFLLASASLFFHQYMFAVYVGFILLGLGIGLTLPGATSGASLSVGRREQGAVAGRISAAQGLGTALGPIVGTSLFNLNSLYPYIFTGVLFSIASGLVWTRHRSSA